jgi:hypothetical protein
LLFGEQEYRDRKGRPVTVRIPSGLFGSYPISSLEIASNRSYAIHWSIVIMAGFFGDSWPSNLGSI